MCRAFEEVRNESFNRGAQWGVQQTAISNIKSLMKKMNWTPLQAMDALSIPPEEQTKYAELLSV